MGLYLLPKILRGGFNEEVTFYFCPERRKITYQLEM
jgi:hypothetical protein